MQFSLDRRSYALREPVKAAHGTVTEREILVLSVTDGVHTGLGEACPIASYSKASLQQCEAALASLVGREVKLDPDLPGSESQRVAGELPPEARSAVDCALHDLAARRAEVPLWRLLGSENSAPVQLSALLTGSTADDLARQAAEASEEGFSTVKVKVGSSSDAENLAAIRNEIHDRIRLRLDANCAWEKASAVSHLGELQQFQPELCEQPVAGAEAIANLATTTSVRLALDEDATESGALTEVPPAVAICLKLSAWGGVSRLVSAAIEARSAGHQVFLGSTLDGPVGIAASLHAAVAIAPELASGLATLTQFSGNPMGPRISDGRVVLDDSPGIGFGADGHRR